MSHHLQGLSAVVAYHGKEEVMRCRLRVSLLPFIVDVLESLPPLARCGMNFPPRPCACAHFACFFPWASGPGDHCTLPNGVFIVMPEQFEFISYPKHVESTGRCADSSRKHRKAWKFMPKL